MSVASEDRLDDEDQNEINASQEGFTGRNSTIMKLFKRFRNKGIDSRKEMNGVYQSIKNSEISNTSLKNIGNTTQLKTISPTATENNTDTFLIPKLQIEDPIFKPTDNNTFNLKSCNTNIVLMTIAEESDKKSISPLITKKPTNLAQFPVLPPLSKASSVKERWSILLSKAKGGVENIPKSFIGFNEANGSVSLKINTSLHEQRQDKSCDTFKEKIEQSQLKLFSKKSRPINSTITSTSNEKKERFIFRSKFDESLTIPEPNLEEAGGFYLDLEMVDFDHPTIIDDCMKRNPQQLLSYFIVYRKELKIEVGNLNAKVSNVDKKICEILDLISSNKTKSENFVTNI